MYRKLEPKLVAVVKEGYTLRLFRGDLLGGLTVGIVALPLAIALAIASGVKPEQGLYTAIFAGATIAVLGGTRTGISGPTGAFIVIVYGIVQKYGYDGLAVATLIAGILLVIMGLARMGALLKFVPYPVTVGFTAGIALIIFLLPGQRSSRPPDRKGPGRFCREMDRIRTAYHDRKSCYDRGWRRRRC